MTGMESKPFRRMALINSPVCGVGLKYIERMVPPCLHALVPAGLSALQKHQ